MTHKQTDSVRPKSERRNEWLPVLQFPYMPKLNNIKSIHNFIRSSNSYIKRYKEIEWRNATIEPFRLCCNRNSTSGQSNRIISYPKWFRTRCERACCGSITKKIRRDFIIIQHMNRSCTKAMKKKSVRGVSGACVCQILFDCFLNSNIRFCGTLIFGDVRHLNLWTSRCKFMFEHKTMWYRLGGVTMTMFEDFTESNRNAYDSL